MQNQTTHHKGKQEERQVGRQTGRQEGRQAGTQAGRRGRQNVGEAGHTIQHRETRRETRGRQDLRKADAPSNTGTHVGRQWETNTGTRKKTMGHKGAQGLLKADMIQGGDTIQHWHQCRETMGDDGETRPRKADTPSSTGTHVGRQWETMACNRRQGETGNKKGHNGRQLGDNGKQWKTRQGKTRPRGGGQAIQHRRTCEETMGDKGRQDIGKADTPSNKGKQEGRWETRRTRPREGGHTIQHRQRRGDKTAGRRTHHPRRGTIQHRHACGETRGDKTSGRRTHHPPAEGTDTFETSRPTWVSVQDVVLKQTEGRPRKPSQSIPELSHFYRTHANKTMSLLLSLCSLLTCHFLDTKQMRSRMLTSFCQLHRKRSKTHVVTKVFTSRHGLFVQISLSVWKTLKHFKHQNMFHDVSLRFVGNSRSEFLQNVALFSSLRDKIKLNFSDQRQSKFLLPKSQNEFYEIILRTLLPFPSCASSTKT